MFLPSHSTVALRGPPARNHPYPKNRMRNTEEEGFAPLKEKMNRLESESVLLSALLRL